MDARLLDSLVIARTRLAGALSYVASVNGRLRRLVCKNDWPRQPKPQPPAEQNAPAPSPHHSKIDKALARAAAARGRPVSQPQPTPKVPDLPIQPPAQAAPTPQLPPGFRAQAAKLVKANERLKKARKRHSTRHRVLPLSGEDEAAREAALEKALLTVLDHLSTAASQPPWNTDLSMCGTVSDLFLAWFANKLWLKSYNTVTGVLRDVLNPPSRADPRSSAYRQVAVADLMTARRKAEPQPASQQTRHPLDWLPSSWAGGAPAWPHDRPWLLGHEAVIRHELARALFEARVRSAALQALKPHESLKSKSQDQTDARIRSFRALYPLIIGGPSPEQPPSFITVNPGLLRRSGLSLDSQKTKEMPRKSGPITRKHNP